MKPNYFKHLILGAAILLSAATSCSNDPNRGPDNDKVAASVTAGISTRAHDGQWDTMDSIGIAVLSDASGQVWDNIYNYKYITPTANGEFQPAVSANTIFFPQDGSAVKFKAYFPYNPAIGADLNLPVSVSDQSKQEVIDLMTAEHLSGYTKTDKQVKMRFHHRLSKVIFNIGFEEGEVSFPLENMALAIKGGNTTATYSLMGESLAVDNSQADISVPYRGIAGQREGIIMPRDAGTGMSFVFTAPDGGEYTALMDDGLQLRPGYKYTFNIKLRSTPISVSADIEPWIDGPTSSYNAIQFSTPAGASSGVNVDDVMHVYLETDTGYEHFADYKYLNDGTWKSDPATYWEMIGKDNVNFRAYIETAGALNKTQMHDIVVANKQVDRNKPIELTFDRAMAKVFVELSSTTIAQADLDNAIITMPDYAVGGDMVDGVFVPGTTHDIITVERNVAPDGRSVAIFQPQTVSAGGAVVSVEVNGRTYTANAATGGLNFAAGEARLLKVTVDETETSLSAVVVPWQDGTPVYLNAVDISMPGGTSSGVRPGDVMKVYLSESGVYSHLRDFVYNANGMWTTSPILYWEDITEDPAYFRAAMEYTPKLNDTQLPDILIAEEVTVPKNGRIGFELKHAASKVIVRLVSSTFSADDLNGAVITLPGYLTGATEQLGEFILGTTPADVRTDRTDPGNAIAIVQPQTIASGNTVVRAAINGVNYDAAAPASGVEFKAGEAKIVTVTIEKTSVGISVQVTDWTEDNLALSAISVGTPAGASTNVRQGDVMTLWTGDDNTRTQLTRFTYSGTSWTSSTPVYWESLPNPTRFYGSIPRQAKYNDTQVDDNLVATPVSVSAGDAVNFELTHPVAKVTVVLKSSDGSISAADLANMTMVLPQYVTGGSYDNGVYIAGQGSGDIKVAQGVGDNNDSAIALIDPQRISAGATVIQITDPTNNHVYNVTYGAPVWFQANVSTIIEVDINRVAISMSANVTDWQQGNTLTMTPAPVFVSGSLGETGDFFREKTIHLYKFGGGFRTEAYTYLPALNGNGYTWHGQQIYWEDQPSFPIGIMAAYFPVQSAIPAINATTASFPWNLPSNQTGGYDNYDLLTSTLSVTSPSYANFSFKHPMSKVRVEIAAGEGFTAADFTDATVTLNNFRINGSISTSDGDATPTSAVSDITPYVDENGSAYSALVMPQTVMKDTKVVTVTLKGYPNYPVSGLLENSNLIFEAGKESTIKITIKKTGIQLSATVEAWTQGDTGSVTIE